MKKFVALALGLVAVAGFAAGCGKSSPSEPQGSAVTPSAADVASVNAAIAANPTAVDENVYEGTEPASLDPAGALGAVRPLFWWRKINTVTRTFDTQFSNPDSLGRPTMAVVAVHKRLQGTFNILVGDSLLSADSLLRKPLDDRWERRLLMKRVAVDSLGNPVWRLVGTSGVEVRSAGGATRIQGIRIVAGAVDTTVTDPLQLHRLRRVLLIPPGTPVQVTVTTGAANDIVLMYRWHFRARFHNNGDGTYTARWTTSDEEGLRHFGVDALSNGTLLDDAAPYDSDAWIFPFAVHDRDADMNRDR